MDKDDKRLKNLTNYTSDRSEKLADKPLCVKLPVEIDEAIRSLPNTSSWVRDTLENAVLHKNNLNNSPDYQEIKSKLLNEWYPKQKTKNKKLVEFVIDEFINELNKQDK